MLKLCKRCSQCGVVWKMDIIKSKKLFELGCFHLAHFLHYPLISPRILQLSFINRCNLSCKMCSVGRYATSQTEELSPQELEEIITKALRHFKIRELIITGGEPLLAPESVLKIAGLAKKNNLRAILTTNGILLAQYAPLLATSGITHFHISLDGLKNTHNALRNNPAAFDKTKDAVRCLAELRRKHNYNYSIGLAAVILKTNIDELYELFELGDVLGADILDLFAYLPDNTDFSHPPDTDLWPQTEDMVKFIQIYKKIKNAKTRNIKLNPNFDVNRIIKYYTKTLQRGDWKCFAGYKNFFITMSDPNEQGRYEPCLFMCKTQIPLRDFGFDLKKIWYSRKVYKARRQISMCRQYCYQACFSLPGFKECLKSGPATMAHSVAATQEAELVLQKARMGNEYVGK